MTWQLGGSIAGLAAVDSLNPATLIAITVILLGSRRRPLAEALAFVGGAFTSVFLVGLALYLGADAAASSITGALDWLRRGALGLATLVLLVSAVRSLRVRHRSAVGLPAWFTPFTAAGLGVLMTGADLPNAFPYFIAIERLLAAEIGTATAVGVLAAYALFYCLPCLVLLALGLRRGERVTGALRRLHDRFGSDALIPPSPLRAAALLAAALAVGSLAVFV
jgi:cytochrome c biogenesis protein CcdA